MSGVIPRSCLMQVKVKSKRPERLYFFLYIIKAKDLTELTPVRSLPNFRTYLSNQNTFILR